MILFLNLTLTPFLSTTFIRAQPICSHKKAIVICTFLSSSYRRQAKKTLPSDADAKAPAPATLTVMAEKSKRLRPSLRSLFRQHTYPTGLADTHVQTPTSPFPTLSAFSLSSVGPEPEPPNSLMTAGLDQRPRSRSLGHGVKVSDFQPRSSSFSKQTIDTEKELRKVRNGSLLTALEFSRKCSSNFPTEIY